ncbi:MAG: nucleotidyl transferase AbiEii/AbiGii toxin family protein [Saprospiraceae bacterium]|nr:nucleotidyl transferase AbiEii/AbiGii toxin family protein [Saprospiraceae bacterium]
MLHKETVSPLLLDILRRLFSFRELDQFVLVGGTALSLRIGHRKSIDIDLFTNGVFPADTLPDFFRDNGFEFRQQSGFKGGIFGYISNIKADFIRHAYPWVTPPEMIEDIRIASVADIAAMKLNAITGSGKRLKDFADVAYLSVYMSLAEMLDYYENKYPDINGMMAVKSLCYHDDIDFSITIDFMDNSMNWVKIKSRILKW